MPQFKVLASIVLLAACFTGTCAADYIHFENDGRMNAWVIADEYSGGNTVVGNAGILYVCRNEMGQSVPCEGLGTETLNMQCSIDGGGNPVNENGTVMTLGWRGANLSFAEGGYSEYGLTIGVGSIVWKIDFVPNYYVGRDLYTAVCSLDLSGVNVEVRRGNDKVVEPTITFTATLQLAIDFGIEISRPPHVRGRLGDSLEFPFTMSVRSRSEGNYILDWSVNEPCSRWAPQLHVSAVGSGGTVVLAPNNTDSALVVSDVVNELKVSVTPDRIGEFQCVGTLTVAPD